MARQSRPKPDGEPNKGGRPRLIDQPSPIDSSLTYSEMILQYVRLGAPLTIAARSAGIGDTTLEEWRRRGKGTDRRDDPDGRFARFASDLEQAEAESVLRLVMALREAVAGDAYETVRDVTVTKHVRDQDGRIVPVTERTVATTRGVHRYPKVAEFLLTRRAPEFFGQQVVVQPSQPEPEMTEAGASAALESAWASYDRGRADGAAEVEAELSPRDPDLA